MLWLANLIAILCILAWRVLWLTMVNRVSPDLPAKLAFTQTEVKLLKHLVPATTDSGKNTVGDFLMRLARLGGYLNRTQDAPPGSMVLWRGMVRLTDIHLGFTLAQHVGNWKVRSADTRLVGNRKAPRTVTLLGR